MVSTATDYDPFDPANLRITADAVAIATENTITAIPVRKPKKDEFFRVHPDDGYRLDAYVVERDGERERETYLVPPTLSGAVPPEVIRPVRLLTCLSRKGTLFLWPAKLCGETSSPGYRWSATALRIASQAEKVWVRMYGDRDLGGYSMVVARGSIDEPKWPDMEFRKMLRMGFENSMIDGPDHPVLRELNGEL